MLGLFSYLKDIATVTAQDWSAWEDCSVTCGGGKQTRTRDVAVPATNGGKACVGNFGLKTHGAERHENPLDCEAMIVPYASPLMAWQ